MTQGGGTLPTSAQRGSVRWPLLAGAGGLVFVVLVIAQNILRGATQPANDATTGDILSFFADKAWVTHVGAVAFVLSAPALFVFAAGLVQITRVADPASAPWGYLGLMGVALLATLFGSLNAIQISLVAGADDLVGNDALIHALWNLHNAIFVVNQLAIGLALLGLGNAARIGRLTRRWVDLAVLAGAGLLAVSSMPGAAILGGSPVILLGLAGFLCWLLFVATVSARLLRA